MRLALVLAALGLLAHSATAEAAGGALIDGVPYVEQPRGPFCVAAAAVMVGRFHGRPLETKPLARTLTVHADGIAWIDLVEALPAHGLEGLLVDGTADDVRALLDGGLPVIVPVRDGGLRDGGLRDGGPRHAWVVHGHGPDGWRILDPAAPGLRRIDRAGFAERWTGGLVILRPLDRPPPPALPWAGWRAESARIRAEGWLKRARQRPATDALALLDRAAALAPTHVAVHLQRAAVLGESGRGPAACAAARTALSHARAPVERQIALDVARKLACEPPGRPRTPEVGSGHPAGTAAPSGPPTTP